MKTNQQNNYKYEQSYYFLRLPPSPSYYFLKHTPLIIPSKTSWKLPIFNGINYCFWQCFSQFLPYYH